MNVTALRPLRFLPLLATMAACVPAPGPYSEYPPQTISPSATSGTLGGVSDYRTGSTQIAVGTPIVPQSAYLSAAPMRMSANEILASLPNNTASGYATNGTPYYAYFQPNGQQRFREGQFATSGEWHVLPDGRFCSRLSRINAEAEQCYVLSHSGTTISFQYADGTPAGSFTLLAGNPQGL